MLKTRVAELFGIKYPVLPGGMARVSSAAPVAAVSNTVGLDVLGAGSMEPELVREEIKEIKSLADQPYGVNIMLMMPTATGVVDVCY